MSYITWFLGLIGFFALRTVSVDGYSRECDFNQTIFTQVGTTASFLYNFTDIAFFFGVRMGKTSGSTKGYIVRVSVYDPPIISHTKYYDEIWKNRLNISIPSYSDDQFILKIDLNNVSMADNGTYRIRGGDYTCYVLYVMRCDFNQTIFTPEGTTATFLYNLTDKRNLDLDMYKSRGSNEGHIFSVRVFDPLNYETSYYNEVWKNRPNISIPSYSDDPFIMRIDLNNVSMEDNGTYLIRDIIGIDNACYILYVMRTRIEPSRSQEEHEPMYVFAHPQASLIKRPLTNATMVWLLDGKSDKETASFIEQGDSMWIPSLRKGHNERNVTYRAIQDDGRITEVNTTIKVRYGPSHPLKLVPSKTYYNMMSGDTMPAIICTSECNPPCNVSWGEHSKDNILNKGAVTTEDTGEYTCTAKSSDGRIVEQTVIVFVSDNSNFIIAIACLASVQAVIILATGLCTFFIYKRKDSSCCHVQNKTDSRDVALQLSSVQGSENAAYEELKHETRNNVNNVYSETNLSTTEDRAVGMTYENTNFSG